MGWLNLGLIWICRSLGLIEIPVNSGGCVPALAGRREDFGFERVVKDSGTCGG